jgi:branched-chain amino acid transport system substrate-binding protein
MALTRRSFLAAGAALAGSAGTTRPALAAYGDEPVGGTVTLAVVAPFTGDQIRLGEQLGNGVRAAIDDTNELRGALDRTFVMRTFDDQGLLASGLVNAEFACDDPTVVAVIGHLSGRITEAALPTYVNNRMPVVCPASTYDRLTAHGYGNIVRLTAKDSTEGRAAARYIAKTAKPSSVVVLTQDGDYGPDVADGFSDQMDGDKIKTNVVTFSWNKANFPAVTKSALDFKPDAIFLAGLPKDMGPVVPQLRAAGYTGPFFASQGFFDPLTLAKYAADLEGLTISTSMPPLALAPGAFRIKNDFERRYGAFTPLSAFSYAAAQILIAVVRRNGSQDRLAVARTLNASSTFETVVGPISFQNDGDPQDPNVYFYRITNGVWKYVSSSYPSSFVVR